MAETNEVCSARAAGSKPVVYQLCVATHPERLAAEAPKAAPTGEEICRSDAAGAEEGGSPAG